MNAYTTDPEEIVSALMHADSDNVLLVGDSCVALAQIIVELTRQVEGMRESSCRLYAEVEALKFRMDYVEDLPDRLDELDTKLSADKGLEQKVLELTKRLDELDARNKEAIEQAIAYGMYENGLTHL